MKINKYTFILPILLCIIIYLIGAFVAANLNISNWEELGRFIIGIFFLFAIALGILLADEIE